jgi:hypothetical protein
MEKTCSKNKDPNEHCSYSIHTPLWKRLKIYNWSTWRVPVAPLNSNWQVTKLQKIIENKTKKKGIKSQRNLKKRKKSNKKLPKK